MIKMYKMYVAAVVLLTCAFALAFTAEVKAGGFSVAPVFPSNQRAESTGSFNLDMEPGQFQEVFIQVTNQQDNPIEVEINLITPGTNRNGIIDYTSTGVLDETLINSFSDIAFLPVDNIVTIPPNTVAQVPFIIEVPEEGFEGEKLGAVHVLLGITDEELEAAGTIVNRFANVIAVRLNQVGSPPMSSIIPDFVLGGVDMELVNHRASIVANIRHPQPRLSMGALVHSQVYAVGGDSPIFSSENISVDFAPHSIFPLTMTDRAGYGIAPGDYIIRIQMEHEGRNWSFEEAFTIEAQHAAAINVASVNQQQNPASQMNNQDSADGEFPWIPAVIAANVVAIGAVAFYLIRKSKKKTVN